MKKNKKHFLGENSYTRYNVDAILGTTSAKNSKKALSRGKQLYYIQRQRNSDDVFLQAYLYIYHTSFKFNILVLIYIDARRLFLL